MAHHSETAQLTPAVRSQDHIQGPETAAVTLVEYGDDECPYYGQAYPIIKEIQRRLGSQLRFVFRHFPLSNMHDTPNTQPRQLKLSMLRTSSGRCMTISTNIKLR